jgi:hypothetical protein
MNIPYAYMTNIPTAATVAAADIKKIVAAADIKKNCSCSRHKKNM